MPPKSTGSRASAASVARITLADLVHAGMLQPGEQFVYEGHYATVMPNGDLHTHAGAGAGAGTNSSDSAATVPDYLNPTYSSLSSWCSDVKRRGKDSASSVTVSGWVKARLAANPKITVDAIRKQYLKSIGLLDDRGKPVANPPPIPQHAGHAASHAISGGQFATAPTSAAAHAHDDDEHDSDDDDTYGQTNYYEQSAAMHQDDHDDDNDHDDDDDDDQDHSMDPLNAGSASSSSRAGAAVPFGRARHANYNEADTDSDDPEFDAAKYERQKRLPKRKRGIAAARARQAAVAAANQTGNASAAAAAAARRPPAVGKRVSNPAKAAVSKISVTAAKHIGAVLKQQQQQQAQAQQVPSSEPDFLLPAMKRSRPSGPGAAGYDLPTAMAASSSSLAQPNAPEPILATPATATSNNQPQPAGTAITQDKHNNLAAAAAAQKHQDLIPTPAVVVFPLGTNTKHPDPLTFRASTACMDCSAVIRPEDDHLTCASCAEAHHPYCTPLYICPPPAAHQRDRPWICIFCTFCAKCERNSPRDQLARCSDCTKVYHLDCGQVSAEMIATDGTIVCFECAKCWSCGVTPASQLGGKAHQQAQAEGKPLVSPPRWDRHPIRAAYQCQTCTTYYANGHFCTVCHKAYSEDDFDTPMLGCDGPCAKWVHKACDPALAGTQYDEIAEDGSEYLCPVCREPEGTDVMTIPAVVNAPGYGDKERKVPGGAGAGGSTTKDAESNIKDDEGVVADEHDAQAPPTPAPAPQPLEHPFADVHGQPIQLPASDDNAHGDADGMQVDTPVELAAAAAAAPAYTCMPPMHPLAPERTPTEAALDAFITHRTCAFCGQHESTDPHGLEDGIGRLVFLGGPDPMGLGTGQWAHTGCFYWSVPSSSTSMMGANAAVDEARVLDALEAVRDAPCTLCHLGGANVACGHPAGCATAYHWSCLVRAMYGGNKSYPQVKSLTGMAGGPNEVKKAKRAHIDVYTHDVRCHLHLSTALTVHLPGIIQPTMDECIRVCRMRMAIAHDPTVPLYVSAVPAPTPGKLLTTAPPYEPACLVVGGAVVTHIGRLPFEDPTVLLERPASATVAAGDAGPVAVTGPPVIIPVGYTVVRRFWSYKHRGTVTYVVMSREVADENEADVEAAQVAAQAAADQTNTDDDAMDTSDDATVGQVVHGEPTHDHVIVDRYTIPRAEGHRLQWRVRIADDPQGEFTARATADILPQLLARFPADAPFLIGRTHHYLVRPESLVLLHHPTIVRFIENLPHAAQISAKEYVFQYVDHASLANMREAECAVRRGSSRT
ncbi:hypothetical protein BCR44DRAFT_134729, partial [Catenaria anguillulae PL171]